MSTKVALPPLDLSKVPSMQNDHLQSKSSSRTCHDGTPRSPGYPRGFESLLAPLPALSPTSSPSNMTQVAAVRSPPFTYRTSPPITSNIGLAAHSQVSSEEQISGLWDRLAMIEGRRYHMNSCLIREDRRQCRELLKRLNTAGAGSLSSFSCLVLELLQLKPIPGPATRVWEQKFGGYHGSKGINLDITPPFRCEFGYNLHFGNDVKVETNCYMNDASIIRIGNRVSIGKNVSFNCNLPSTTNLENGVAIAQKIEIGDGVVIGDDVTICGGVIIGAGSQICANITLTQSIGESQQLMIYQQPLQSTRRVTMPNTSQSTASALIPTKFNHPTARSIPISTQQTIGKGLSEATKSNQSLLPTTCDPYATSKTHSL